MSDKSEWPTGIRKRGDVYQFNVSFNGRRMVGTKGTLKEAVAARHAAMEEMKQDDNAGKVRVRTDRDPNHVVTRPKNMKLITLETAVNLTKRTRWEGTKGERAIEPNVKSIVTYFGKTTHLDEITTERVNDFVDYLKKEKNSDGTINRKLSALSVIIATAEENGKETASPKIRRRKEYKGRERFITREEEKQLLDLLTIWGKYDHHDFVVCLIDIGCRCSELRDTIKKDVDFSQGKYGTITLWRTKNNHPRTVPLTERVAKIMQERFMKVSGERIFPHEGDWLRKTWDRAKAHMGLSKDKQFIPHCLRHTCASRMVQQGVPIPMVQQWMGHETIQSTMRYAHLTPTNLFGIVDILGKAV